MNFVVVFIISVLATQAVNGQNNQNWQQQNINNQNANFTPVQQEDSVISSRFNFFDIEILELFNDNENYFISPASIKITLAMLLEGSKGRCAQEISKILRIPVDVNSSRATLNNLLNNLSTKSGNTILNSANLVAVSNKYTIVPEYRNILQHYKANIVSTDFNNTSYSASVINSWVERETQGLIPEIISPDNFNVEASLIIANALFFKAQWKIEFEQARTKLEYFQTSTNRYKVKAMKVNSQFRYRFIENLDAQALELPYSDGEYAMLILLPSETQSVDGLQKDLQHTNFVSIIDSLESTEIAVSLPKFEIEYNVNLVPTLEKMGIREIFSENANLSGIIQQSEVKISKIFHKAKVEVNEKGTTAAAVTGAVVIPLMGSSSESFIAHRPFLFFIYNMYTKNVLFEGRLNRPLKFDDQLFGTVSTHHVTYRPVNSVVPNRLPNVNSNQGNKVPAPSTIVFSTSSASNSVDFNGNQTKVVTTHHQSNHYSSSVQG